MRSIYVAFLLLVVLAVGATANSLDNLPDHLKGASLDSADNFEFCHPPIAKFQPGRVSDFWVATEAHRETPEGNYFQNLCEDTTKIYIGLKGLVHFGRGSGDTKLVGGYVRVQLFKKNVTGVVAVKEFDACELGACCRDPSSAPMGFDLKVCKMNSSPMRGLFELELPPVITSGDKLELKVEAMGYIMRGSRGRRPKELFCVKKNVPVEMSCDKRGEWVSAEVLPNVNLSENPNAESAAERRRLSMGFDAAEYLAGTSAGAQLDLQGIPEQKD